MVQWIIAEVMADQEVDPKEVVSRFRRHSVYGWGTFKCSQCHVSWSSQITWVTLDIKEQRIRRRFKQKCKQCGQPQRPWWHVEEFAYMMEFALDRYRKLVDGNWKPAVRPNPQPDKAPHKSELCERCGFGSRKCWAVQEARTKEDDMEKEAKGDMKKSYVKEENNYSKKDDIKIIKPDTNDEKETGKENLPSDQNGVDAEVKEETEK